MIELENKNKRVILAISEGYQSAVAWYRIIQPLSYLNKHNDKDYEVLVLSSSNVNIESEALEYVDIVHFHANITYNKQLMSKLYLMQKNGCKLILDLDDFFEVPASNPFSKTYNSKLTNCIKQTLNKVDYVTCTTSIFKNELKKYTNKKITVFPNVLNNSLHPEIPSNKLRIGLMGGASHEEDYKQIKELVSNLQGYNIQWVLNGFDTRGVNPHFSLWNEFESMLTNNYTTITPDYYRYLKSYNKEEYPLVSDMPYRRCWTKPIEDYTQHYQNIDVLLAPLSNNKFNQMKSELKIVEAGTFNKGIICSDVGIYSKVIINKYNGLLCNKPSDWVKNIKLIIDNPELLKSMRDNLTKDINNKYNIDKWNKLRIKFYESI